MAMRAENNYGKTWEDLVVEEEASCHCNFCFSLFNGWIWSKAYVACKIRQSLSQEAVMLDSVKEEEVGEVESNEMEPNTPWRAICDGMNKRFLQNIAKSWEDLVQEEEDNTNCCRFCGNAYQRWIWQC